MQRHAALPADEPGERVVERHAGAVVAAQTARRASAARGSGSRNGIGRTRCGREPGGEQAALLQRLVDQAEIELLEVAQAAVDELARARRRARGQVARLDQGDRQPAGGGVERRAGAGDAAADDDDVEALPAQPAQVGRAPLRGEAGGREAGDRRVTHGSTVQAWSALTLTTRQVRARARAAAAARTAGRRWKGPAGRGPPRPRSPPAPRRPTGAATP